jgi:NitT/TauT family transport system permease protein
MWYVLFNVIAGAQAIPAELFEVAVIYKLPAYNVGEH